MITPASQETSASRVHPEPCANIHNPNRASPARAKDALQHPSTPVAERDAFHRSNRPANTAERSKPRRRCERPHSLPPPLRAPALSRFLRLPNEMSSLPSSRWAVAGNASGQTPAYDTAALLPTTLSIYRPAILPESDRTCFDP